MTGLRRHYGSGPLHLLGLLACFALSGYVATRIAGAPGAVRMGLWFGGAVVAHDLVLFPAYTVVDGLLRRDRAPRSTMDLMILNHVRVPAVISGLLLLVWFPLIFGLSDDTYRAASGLTTDPYLKRFLLVAAALFGGSAAVLVLRVLAGRRRRRPS